MSKIESIAFTILIILAFIGTLALAVTLHEYSHVADYSVINATGDVCLVNIPSNFSSPMGYYKMRYLADHKAKGDQIDGFTEYKAYTISYIIITLGMLAIVIVLGYRLLSNIPQHLNTTYNSI